MENAQLERHLLRFSVFFSSVRVALLFFSMDQTTVTMIMTTTQTAIIIERRMIWVWGQISGRGGGVVIEVGEAKPVGLVLGVPVELGEVVGVGDGLVVGVGLIVGLVVGFGVGVGWRVGWGLTVMAFVVAELIWGKSLFVAVIVREPGVRSTMLKVPTPFTRLADVGNLA